MRIKEFFAFDLIKRYLIINFHNFVTNPMVEMVSFGSYSTLFYLHSCLFLSAFPVSIGFSGVSFNLSTLKMSSP